MKNGVAYIRFGCKQIPPAKIPSVQHGSYTSSVHNIFYSPDDDEFFFFYLNLLRMFMYIKASNAQNIRQIQLIQFPFSLCVSRAGTISIRISECAKFSLITSTKDMFWYSLEICIDCIYIRLGMLLIRFVNLQLIASEGNVRQITTHNEWIEERERERLIITCTTAILNEKCRDVLQEKTQTRLRASIAA